MNETEFEQLVRYIRQVRINSGASQAEDVARSYGETFGHDPERLLDMAHREGDGWRWG
jgi:hypothetical protein